MGILVAEIPDETNRGYWADRWSGQSVVVDSWRFFSQHLKGEVKAPKVVARPSLYWMRAIFPEPG
jgi:hypothetical protein